jgi:thioredoxin 1
MSRPMRAIVQALALAVLVAGCAGGPGSPAAEAPAAVSSTPGSTPGDGAVAGGGTAPGSGATVGGETATGSATSGAYLSLADYERDASSFAGDDVVLFFAASWCSSCRRTQANIEADLSAIPPGLVIVVVDYDTERDLRRRYGVTVQHTFVQIDAEGEPIKRWTGTLTAQAIAEQTV